MDVVQVPEQAVSTAGQDILVPLKELQQGLGILPLDNQKAGLSATFAGPPESVAIIQAGGTALSKWWSLAIGGGTATVTSVLAKFWHGQTGPIRVALIFGMAGLLVAAIIAVSIIVAADVKGRAQGTVALYAARASVAAQFLHESVSASRPPSATVHVSQAAPAAPDDASNASNQTSAQGIPVHLATSSAPALILHTPTNQAGHLAGIRQRDDGSTELLFVRESDGQTSWYPASDITVIEFTYPANNA